jgi:hypothetical protein
MKDLSPTAWDFLGELGLRNPDLARTLRDEMDAGTFVLLDGEPVLRDFNPRVSPAPGPAQLKFETKGRAA